MTESSTSPSFRVLSTEGGKQGKRDWNKYLCIKDQRTIRDDNTITYNKKLCQLEESASKKVDLEERIIDGSLFIISKGRSLKYKEIIERPKQMVSVKKDMRAYNRATKPLKDHPWKQKGETWDSNPPTGL